MMNIQEMTRGQRIRYLREAKGWDQSELEHRSGVTRTQISALETGRATNPRRDTMERLSAALGVTRLYLEEGIESTDVVRYPAWARDAPDLPPEHASYIRRLIDDLAEKEADEDDQA